MPTVDAGWSSLVARRAHNPKVVGSNPAPATTILDPIYGVFYYPGFNPFCRFWVQGSRVNECYEHFPSGEPHILERYMIQDKIEQLLKPAIEDMGYVLWGCEYLAQGKHSLLRVFIDSDKGIKVEDCEQVSRQVGALLDVEDPIPGNYSLEISSPGIPRPLFRSWQYPQYIGQDVHIKLFKPVAGKRKFTGIIVSADENTLVLDIEITQQAFLFSNIVKANLTVE